MTVGLAVPDAAVPADEPEVAVLPEAVAVPDDAGLSDESDAVVLFEATTRGGAASALA
jgi:hypothetical protein